MSKGLSGGVGEIWKETNRRETHGQGLAKQ